MQLPNKKTTNYVDQQSGSELLIYNLSTNQAFCLNDTAATVFAACDGETSFETLKKRSNFSSELISLTLDELQRRGLIENDYSSPFAKISRREVVRRVGLASMIALPIISSLAAPGATHAASCIASGSQSTASVGTQSASTCFSTATSACCSRASTGGQAQGCSTPTIQNPCTCFVNCATVTTIPK